MGSPGNAQLLSVWRFTPDVLTAGAVGALVLCAADVIDIGYALVVAGALVGIGLFIEPKPPLM